MSADQTGVPISVIIGNLLVRLESDEGADAGREEIPKPLVLKGITARSLDRIRVAERLEIIRRPIVVDEKAPLAFGPSYGTLKLEIVDVVVSARIGVCEAADREGDVLPLRRDAGTVVDLDAFPKLGVGSPHVGPEDAVPQIEFGLHCGKLIRVRNAAEHIVRRERCRS